MRLCNLMESDYGGIRVGSTLRTKNSYVEVMAIKHGMARFGSMSKVAEDCLLLFTEMIGSSRSWVFIDAIRLEEGIGGRLTPDLTLLWHGPSAPSTNHGMESLDARYLIYYSASEIQAIYYEDEIL